MFIKLFSKFSRVLITSSAAFLLFLVPPIMATGSYGYFGEPDCPEELLK